MCRPFYTRHRPRITISGAVFYLAAIRPLVVMFRPKPRPASGVFFFRNSFSFFGFIFFLLLSMRGGFLTLRPIQQLVFAAINHLTVNHRPTQKRNKNNFLIFQPHPVVNVSSPVNFDKLTHTHTRRTLFFFTYKSFISRL